MRSILLQQPGVLDARAKWQEGRGWAIYDPSRVTAQELAAAVSPYYPSQVMDDRPYSGD